ncbi:antitoxin Xre/MbcA/ParS toxin-binding domain-containing protein [Pseudomonas sp. NA-150]|uniref:type II RES/Xre toxin-antitoxin system antitoxin n=1 Tax=Pseudomonas sp. NA-150 TaxID=3367525 RepID=UPI0037C83992
MEAVTTSYSALATPLPTFWLIAHELRDRSESERLKHIQTGFPATWVRATREAFKLSNELLESLFNASISTLERRQKQQQPLDSVASERLDRVAIIATQAAEVFEAPDKASRWMVTANAALGDATPLHLCESEIGARQVRRVLAAMEYGGVV